jgi:hypothetical protein
MPNRTQLRGRALKVTPDARGFGANVEFEVRDCRPAEGYQDFTGAVPGARLVLFSAETPHIVAGRSYNVTARVAGDAFGERIQVENAEPVKEP